ncbi:cytosine permease [Nguyenibacter vanlangensis]|uniref:Cytosine permease n=1 Tax=Nguyenibacter vanlangensis TaxID=1216886 RepID=A0ABZ3D9Q8_9PROT
MERAAGTGMPHDELAPVAVKDWGWFAYLSFWMSDVHSIGGYVMAGTLFSLGLSALQVLGALVAGSLLVCVFCTLMAMPSQRHGVPFAIVVRASFGRRGALLPAAVRAVVAMAWYGIQTWLASNAICLLLVRLLPGLAAWDDVRRHGFLGLSAVGWGCFVILWAVQMLIFQRGVAAIRRFFDLAGPAVYGVMLLLLLYLARRNGWRWPALWHSEAHGGALAAVNAVALVVSYFSGPMLNFGDFARNGRSMRQIIWGNLLGLPVNFVLFSLLSVATTALTLPVFGAQLIDPVAIIARVDSVTATLLAIITFAVATAGINIAANFVSGALDLCALAPGRMNWARAGWLCGVGAVAITPWNLYDDPARMHMTLDVLSAFIGPFFGIVLTDFCLIRRGWRDVRALYADAAQGPYRDWWGCNPVAIGAMLCAVAMALLPEFCAALAPLRNFSWFAGSGIASILYLAGTTLLPASPVLVEPDIRLSR